MASFVFVVDVGSNQLDKTLRKNEKNIAFGNCDIRTLDAGLIGTKVDIIVADIPFISLK